MSRDVKLRLPIFGSAVPAKARVDLNHIYFHELCQPTTEYQKMPIVETYAFLREGCLGVGGG
jgi:hypothetical protein